MSARTKTQSLDIEDRSSRDALPGSTVPRLGAASHWNLPTTHGQGRQRARGQGYWISLTPLLTAEAPARQGRRRGLEVLHCAANLSEAARRNPHGCRGGYRWIESRMLGNFRQPTRSSQVFGSMTGALASGAARRKRKEESESSQWGGKYSRA